ncbi:GtrA family protein [Marivivens sp. LCG002]|uniref:GtrA family protein n=1 Tax=Marivivens sp. LCG002 TaxID=3051171 RepID=UPI002554077D|nr:GtrA family protein [Marivivens sp. LCG002]WIV52183.1 GtrA family protein [Marivivens sp. LCG002]
MTTHPKQSMARTTTMFTIVGLVASGSHFLIAAFLHETLGLGLILANCLGFTSSFVISYFGHRRFSFRSDRPHRSAIPKYAVTAGSGFSANTLTVYALIRYFGAEHLFYILIGISVGAAVVFVASKYWAFAAPKP